VLLRNVESLYKSKLLRLLFFALFLVLFSGCSIKNYADTESKFITFKTPKLRFSDLGYLHKSGDALKLDMFVAGRLVQSISIDYLVCISDGCMRKSVFNEEFLNSAYPDDLLQNIILGRSIYDAKNKVKTENGFEQRIENSDVNIIYRVSSQGIYFKDKKNHILFKIRGVE